MQLLRKKTMTATIALVLMLTMAATFMTCLPVNAVTYTIPTYAYITAVPNPVGVGQTVLVTFWIDQVPTGAIAGYDPVRNWGGFKVTITKPNGNVETKGPYASDAVASAWLSFVPDTVGAWYLEFSWPGQWKNTTASGTTPAIERYYQPATSPKLSLVVQQEPIAEYPLYTLPEQWTRPIEGEIRGAWPYSGSWLMSSYNASYSLGGFNPYTKAVNAPHIVWTKPIAFGGIVGGEFGDNAFYEGHTYETKFSPPLIIAGRLYYHIPRSNNPTGGGLVCVDLRTGEQLWYKNITISLAQLFDYESPNQHGIIPLLWSTGSTYQAFDAFSGANVINIINGRTGTVTFSPKGELLVYILNANQRWLAMWNMTKCVQPTGISWRPSPTTTYDWRNGVQWNVTITRYPPGQSIVRPTQDVILTWTGPSWTGPGPVFSNLTYVGYSTKTGKEMWKSDVTVPIGTSQFGSVQIAVTDGVFELYDNRAMTWRGFDMYSGRQIWGPTEPFAGGAWGFYMETAFQAYGKFYSAAFDGMIHAYDIKTGEHLWDFYSGNAGLETPYGTWPFYVVSKWLVADGKIIMSNNEHSPSKPFQRGYRLHAVDANTGKQIWSILGWYGSTAAADGYVVGWNAYDMQIYCFGKGPTATTVSVSDGVISKGSSVLIQGTITDQSTGAVGTPAVSDKSMEQWMEYLYMQLPCPANATGVPVKLQAVKADGTVIDIATVTSDVYGDFKSAWTPPDEGLYTVMATFAGSESYWTSYDATGLSVGPAPAEPEPVEIPAYPDYTPIFAGIIAAIVIVAILVVYDIFRKRK